MPSPKLTVAVPTFNRASLLKQTLESILVQSYQDFAVVVFDNASTDDTEAVIKGFSDPRLSHSRASTNIGLVRNWNRCIQKNSSPFLCIFHDDDLMLEGFLEKSMAILEAHPDVAFSYCLVHLIDNEGKIHDSQVRAEGVKDGVIEGTDLLEWMVAGQPGTNRLLPSSVVFRSSAMADGDLFDSPHSKHTTDHNLYYRLARRFRVGFLARWLVAVREHRGQESEAVWRASGLGLISGLAERMDAALYLLKSARADDPGYRHWLADQLLMIHRRRSHVLREEIPGLYWNWQEQLDLAKDELDRTIPARTGLILVDEDSWGLGNDFNGRRVWPFPEKDGIFCGAPTDQTEAVRELQRLQQAGAEFIVFMWTTFWWLDFYGDLEQYLNHHAERVLCSPRVVVFRLR
jgi:hypothetical protein